MPIYHVRFACAPDYLARRLPFRPAHLEQLVGLREDGRVVAGGPEPDGTAAHIFYRVSGRAELDALLEANEFNRAGLFAGSRPRVFAEFLEPLDRPPVDAGLACTLVEGAPGDGGAAGRALAALQREGRAAFGGFFEDGAGLAVVRSGRPDEALYWLGKAGGWSAPFTARVWSQTL